jgi:UDP-GlcNAc:undecaprenyl-phosphate GlcNAc-1-phosphate transferase
VLAVFLGCIILGACLGFLPHNLPPARIFMGDTGSLLLGLCLATLTVFSGTKVSALTALAIPVLAVGIPIVDIGYAFIRRALQKKNPFKADRLHLHHRLLALGLPTRKILFIFYYVSAYLGMLAFMLQGASSLLILTNAALLTAGFFLLLGTLGSLDRMRTGQHPAVAQAASSPSTPTNPSTGAIAS